MGQVEHLESLLQIGEGVAVADDGVEAEGVHLAVQRLRVHNFAGGAVNLQAVDINHNAEVVQLVVVGKHKGLPALALLDLAVTQQGVDVDVAALILGGQRHAAGGGNALTQAAGAHIDAGHGVHIGVALQIAVGVAQGGQVGNREEAALRKGGIQAGGAVALAQHKAVAVRILRLLGVNAHLTEIQVGKDVCRGQAAAWMAAPGTVGGFDHTHTHAGRSQFQLQRFQFCHS